MFMAMSKFSSQSVKTLAFSSSSVNPISFISANFERNMVDLLPGLELFGLGFVVRFHGFGMGSLLTLLCATEDASRSSFIIGFLDTDSSIASRRGF